MEGHPVPAGVPVLLVHCATLAPLAVDAGEVPAHPGRVTSSMPLLLGCVTMGHAYWASAVVHEKS